MNVVDIKITNSAVTGGGVSVGAAGSHHDMILRITFSSEWEGLSKKIIWQNSNGQNTVFTLLNNTFLETGKTNVYLVPIPAEPKEFAGKMLFGVKGFLTETVDTETVEIKAVVSAKTEFIVLDSVSDEDAEASAEPSATVAEQLQGEIDNLDAGKVDKVSGYGLVKNTVEQGVLATQQQGNDAVSVYTKDKADALLSEKVDVDGDKVLSDNNFSNDYKTKLDGIEAGAEANDVVSVAGKTGAVTLDKNDVGLSNVDNTADSDKPVSTPQQTALNLKANASDVAAIQGKIPTQASSENQLADKNFVNSSIATETAHYISDTDNQPFTSENDLPTANVTNNDYAFVTGTDSAGNTFYDRYKATVSGSAVTWAKEYRLNNSSFTSAQWAAISSGITEALVTKLSNIDLSQYYTKTETDNALGNKVNKESGKGLSSNDYTTTEKTKLEGIETGAEANIIEEIQVDGIALTPSNKIVNITGKANSADVYTKTEINKKISNTYAFKGEKSVSNINSISVKTVGDIYRLTDSGTLSVGSLEVTAGDNVVWADGKWDIIDAALAKRIEMYGKDVTPTTAGFDFQYISSVNAYIIKALDNTISGDIVIPYEYNDGTHGLHPIYAIEPVKNYVNVTSFTIPKSVSLVSSNGVFEGCTGLEYIEFPDTMNRFRGNNIFKNCTNLKSIIVNNNEATFGAYTDTFKQTNSNFTVYCNAGSTTEEYCLTNNVKYEYIDTKDKQDKPHRVTLTAPSALTVADNTVYYLSNVSSLSITYPTGHFECLLQMETASSDVSGVTFGSGTKFIGDVPSSWSTSSTYEISIRDKIVVIQEVSSNA